jgi:hypothetical protein
MRAFCPHPQPLSQAWERGARAGGDGGVRAIFFIVTLIMSSYLLLLEKRLNLTPFALREYAYQEIYLSLDLD